MLHRIGWVIYVYYLNFVEEKIWRNNLEKQLPFGWEVEKDEEFQSPRTAFCKNM